MKPKELIAALGTLLAEYAEIDEMLDSFISNNEGTAEEKARQRKSNRQRDRITRIYQKAVSSAETWDAI